MSDQKQPFWDREQPNPRRQMCRPAIDVARTLMCDEELPFEVSEYMEHRMCRAAERYGERLTTFNQRDTLQDALEEACDLVVYLRQAYLEAYYEHLQESDSGAQRDYAKEHILYTMEDAAKALLTRLYYFVKHDFVNTPQAELQTKMRGDIYQNPREERLRRVYREQFPGLYNSFEDAVKWYAEVPSPDVVCSWIEEKSEEE